MVAEPGPTSSEKRQKLLNKEPINDDVKRRVKATLDDELKSLEKADHVKLMEQERCGHGSKLGMRLKEKETKQQLAEVATEVIQDEMNKTKMMKNAGNEKSRDPRNTRRRYVTSLNAAGTSSCPMMGAVHVSITG